MSRRTYVRSERRRGCGDNLLQRIRLVVPSALQCCDGDLPIFDPQRPPARCVFQFNGEDNVSEAFPVEYIMRLMANWAQVDCDPYIKIQNTGVSVLFQGFFFRPTNAPVAEVSIDSNNVILSSTLSTGINLSALESIKRGGGIDRRPLQALMWVNCFVRMPYVQLSFRFMGPEDPSRTIKLMARATDAYMYKETGNNLDEYIRWRPSFRSPPENGSPNTSVQMQSDIKPALPDTQTTRVWKLALPVANVTYALFVVIILVVVLGAVLFWK
uniref:ORF24 n=1 Tax=Human herpesvirus 3 TaxID=10335 RepID=A0A4D6F638_HHV3|nr:ORF24 [Human alphaherpesvirus 3]